MKWKVDPFTIVLVIALIIFLLIALGYIDLSGLAIRIRNVTGALP